MDVTSVAQGVYNRYTDTLQKLKSGEITTEEALEFHGQNAVKTRGLSAGVAWTSAQATPLDHIPPALQERMHNAQGGWTPSPMAAAKAYDAASASAPDAEVSGDWGTLSAARLIDENFVDEPTEKQVRDFAETVIQQTIDNLLEFQPHADAMEAAGLSPGDLERVLITRTKDGAYAVAGKSAKADAISHFINDNPEVQALYDQKWTRLGIGL